MPSEKVKCLIPEQKSQESQQSHAAKQAAQSVISNTGLKKHPQAERLGLKGALHFLSFFPCIMESRCFYYHYYYYFSDRMQMVIELLHSCLQK